MTIDQSELDRLKALAKAEATPFDRAAHYKADALAKLEGKNLDGSERRECSSVSAPPPANRSE